MGCSRGWSMVCVRFVRGRAFHSRRGQIYSLHALCSLGCFLKGACRGKSVCFVLGSFGVQNWAAVTLPVSSQPFSFCILRSQEQLPSTVPAKLVALLVACRMRLRLVPVCYIWFLEIHPRPLCLGAVMRRGLLKPRVVGELLPRVGVARRWRVLRSSMAGGCEMRRDPSSSACVRSREHRVSVSHHPRVKKHNFDVAKIWNKI